MQTATSETESKSLDLSICVHHYTLRARCPKGQGKTSSNGSLLGFSALLVMTFYLMLVTDNVHSTSRPSCSDLLCHIFNMYRLIRIGRLVLRNLASDRIRIGSPPRQRLPFSNVLAVTPMMACTSVAS